jgi:hypothetical protein
MLLDRTKLLSKETLKVQQVELGEGDFVFVRQMTGRERDRFERSLLLEVEDRKGNVTYKRALEDFRAKLAVNTLCDESGNNLLNPDDYNVLSQNMSAAKLEHIVNAAQELNKITEEDKDAMVKNSESDQSGGSSSGSLVN